MQTKELNYKELAYGTDLNNRATAILRKRMKDAGIITPKRSWIKESIQQAKSELNK